MIRKNILISILSIMFSSTMLPISVYAMCGIVSTDSGRLNVRSRPTKNSRIISRVSKGSGLNIIDAYNYFYKVKLNNGKVGYVSMAYVTRKLRQDLPCRVVTLQSGRLNIRSRPTRGARVVGRVANESALGILELGNYWAKVKLNNGIVGYASMDYLEY
jgi:uncharacterized protein YgiM (DUF1202 family)